MSRVVDSKSSMQGPMNGSVQQMNTRKNGFTLIELLVTIGILVVLTVGVATIFNSVGKTVAKGGKLSELNQFAARLERVMREDFQNMTRDGFLVIVNKNASYGLGRDQSGNESWDTQLYRGEKTNIDIDLYPGDSDGDGRIRRSDEIMFFRRGDFESARRAISSDMLATSSEAAIYYGHGQKRRPDLVRVNNPTNFFFNPAPWDNNFDSLFDTRLGVNTVGQINPNEFARDWSLLRQVTLLVNPLGAGQSVASEVFGENRIDRSERPYLQDSPRQIALQPAGRSIFTSLSGTDGTKNHRWLFDRAAGGPVLLDPNPHYRVSGMVDVVTEDLATIRSTIQALPISMEPSDYFNYLPGDELPVTKTRDEFENDFWINTATSPRPADALSINLGKQTDSGVWAPGSTLQGDRIRKWMLDALPSRWDLNGSNPQFVSGVRYEDIPTRLMFTDDPNTDAERNQRAYDEANQEMLSASVFIPRCSEFIVEWSYGFVNNNLVAGDPGYKELMWYGLDRYIDTNGDGLIKSDNSDELAARLYTARSTVQAGDDFAYTPPRKRSRGVDSELVVGRPGVMGGGNPSNVEIATFGFNTRASEPGAIWQWPKFVRITMNLADPIDRDVEQTYQIVFKLPELE